MKNFLKVWLNEYYVIFSDIGSMLIMFGVIIIYPFFYPVPYRNEVLKDVPVSVIDMNHSQLSHKLTRSFDANELIKVRSDISDFARAKTALIKGDIGGILYIPEDFEKLVLRGEQAVVSVYSDASYFLIYRQVLTGVYRSAGTFSAGIEIKRMLARGIMPDHALTARDPLSLFAFPLFNPAGGYATYVVPAVLVLILQQSLIIGVGLLSGTLKEKKEPLTFDKTSMSILSLVLGKAFAYFSIYMVHAVYLFGVLFRFYHFPQRGNPLALVLLIIPFLFASIFLAQAVSVFFKNREISIIILLFTSIPALFLSGFAWPKSSIPDWLNHFAMLLPSTACIDSYLRINQMGASLKDVGWNWGILLALTALYFMLAVVSTERQYKRMIQ